MKVRSYFRYKGLPHEWIARSPADPGRVPEIRQAAAGAAGGDARGEGVQDSTPIIERFEAAEPSPRSRPTIPRSPSSRRCSRNTATSGATSGCSTIAGAISRTAWSTAERIARQMTGAQGTLAVAQARAAVAERMMGRLGFVGSNDTTQPTIEASFKRAARACSRLISQTRPYHAGRPAGDGRLRPVGPALRSGRPIRRPARSCGRRRPR